MASPPAVIFKRTKSKPAQRARQPSPTNDNDNDITASTDDSPSSLATKLKNKVKKAKSKSRLSFGGADEEEGESEVFQVKKSNLSKKIALGTHPALNLDKATISPNRGPTYDAAYLNQLKASTPSSRRPLPDTEGYNADVSMHVALEGITMDAEQNDTYIPSESSIQVAKEKRERLRNVKDSEEDFISLSVTRRDISHGPHPESRLVREEDELGEGDDEFAEYTSSQERIALGKKSRKLEATKRRDTMKEMIADAEEEDEETAEWEQEQLRRGGHRTPDQTPPATKVKQVYKPTPIPAATPVPTLAPAISRLTQQLSQLVTSHANNTAALETLTQERNDVDNREREMREMVERAEEKRAWFNSFREWVEGVAGFLDEKYPLLEKLEKEHISLLQERLDLINKRRWSDDEDDLTTFLGVPLLEEPQAEGESDEFGRAISRVTSADNKQKRFAARFARRKRRMQNVKNLEEEEGYSTDSSLPPSDSIAYSEAIESLNARTKEILADVRAEEFRDPGKGRWNLWREKYSDSYIGAWGGLGVVSVWEFWVRLECMSWDCVEDSRSLDSFKWYKGLYHYSRPGESVELGPDGDLVASIISSAVIPLVCKNLEGGALDVYSERHIRRVVDLTEEIEATAETANSKFQSLLNSVAKAFDKAVTDTEGLLDKYDAQAHATPAFNPEAIPARRRFLARRVKLLQNLLWWKKYAKKRFESDSLIVRLVEKCILTAAETGWEVGGEDVARTVTTILPGDAIPASLKQRFGLI